ncbi:MAG: hypothetical protein M3041_21295 [Acidobacteriota bacterium]|nr:hypothetical protein [Acidobacteriota bacterium]
MKTLLLCAVVVSGSVEQHGGNLSIFYRPRPDVLVGASQYKFLDASWAFATANYTRAIRRTSLQGEANLGRGRQRHSFNYTILRIAATQEIVPHIFYVDGENQYVDVDRQRGNLLRGGVTWLPSARATLSASAYKSVSGNLGARFFSGRGEWHFTNFRLLAGGAWGRSQPVLFQQFASPATHITELFAGAAVPAGRGSVTLALDEIRAATRRLRLIVSWASRN